MPTQTPSLGSEILESTSKSNQQLQAAAITKREPGDWFWDILGLSEATLDKLFWVLELACRMLISLSSTFIKFGLVITTAYALLVWRHYAAEEPRTLLIYLSAGLLITNLGEKALDNHGGKSIRFCLVLLLVTYFFPVGGFSRLLQAF